ncbi:MAG: AraC family transcriptional regulator [Verrucomicrobia bacterium]|nr:AraC family transcriptional regulator [Verrucomicrobiota bacterium]
MSKMIPDNTYIRYLPQPSRQHPWGVAVTAGGCSTIAPGTVYPPASRHPLDHRFDWETGRTLEALQVVYIPNGSGRLETAAHGRTRIASGMAFLLHPGEWHRYQPDRRQGWVESWVELTGPTVRALLQSGVFPAASPILRRAQSSGLGEAMEALHLALRQDMAATDPELAALCLRVLAAAARSAEKNDPGDSAIAQKIARGERILAARFHEPVNLEQLARELGVAYSYFRREFKARTGFSPWNYVLHLRLGRARRLLAGGDSKLESVAQAVGFTSGFQLSHAFKRAFGQAPDPWRKNLARTTAR